MWQANHSLGGLRRPSNTYTHGRCSVDAPRSTPRYCLAGPGLSPGSLQDCCSTPTHADALNTDPFLSPKVIAAQALTRQPISLPPPQAVDDCKAGTSGLIALLRTKRRVQELLAGHKVGNAGREWW